jgi:D-arginine dehydrogenase
MFRAPVVVNAAGAWADEIGRMAGAEPVGLVPKRRSAFLFQPPDGAFSGEWPFFMDVAQSFYIKPDAGLLLGSPCNEDPVAPHDVVAEELDVAIAIDNIERMTTLRVRRPKHVWAGLRSFVADGEFVGGYDPNVPGLFWAAAQGGYGIQTSPATGKLYSSMLLRRALPDEIAQFSVHPAALGPSRLRGNAAEAG